MHSTPENLKSDYDLVSKDLVYAHAHWTLFKELFNPNTAEVMSAVTAMGWTMIHDAIVDSVILSLTRLLDPPQSGKQDNLTIPRLIRMSDPAMQSGLDTKCKQAKNLTEDLKAHRHKRIAHSDYGHKTEVQRLPQLTHEKIGKAFEAVDDLMRDLQTQVGSGYTDFEPITEPIGSSIVLFLKAGVRVLELEQDVKCGHITPEELFERVKQIVE